MPELKTYTTPITTYDSFVDRAARDYIGDINRLDTADKSNLVNAINELIHFGNFVISVTGDVDSGYEIDKTGAEITTAIEKKVPIFLLALTDSVSAVLPVSSIEDGKILFSGVLQKDDKTWQNNVSVLYSDNSASVDYVSVSETSSEVSWVDVKDKPFGEEVVSSETDFSTIPTTTFDAIGSTWYKCSNLVPTRKEFMSSAIEHGATADSNIVDIPTEDKLVLDDTNFTGVLFDETSGFGYAVCRATGTHDVVFGAMIITITVPETGIYWGCPIGQTPPETFHFKITYEETNTLDAKYLPMDAIDEKINEALGVIENGTY